MLAIIQRNLKLYFAAKPVLFFSLLTTLLMLMLNVLFLADTISESLKGAVPDAKIFVNNWMLAGILGIQSVSTAVGMLGFKVRDNESKRKEDILITPIKSWQYILGYILSTLVVGIILSIITLILGEIYMFYQLGSLLPISSLLQMLWLVTITVACNSAFMTFIFGFIKTESSLGVIGALTGILIGFLTGLFVPVGSLPDYAKVITNLTPSTYASSLMRQEMTKEQLKDIPEKYRVELDKKLGNVLYWGDHKFSNEEVYAVIGGSIVLLFVLSYLMARQKEK